MKAVVCPISWPADAKLERGNMCLVYWSAVTYREAADEKCTQALCKL